MATGATGQLGLALPVQGELSGTWGDTVNNGITQYTNIAIAGTLTLTGDGAVTLANTTGDASASNITSTLTGAGTVTAQFAIVRVTGTLTTPKIITAPSYSKTYVVVNAATGSTVSFIRSGQTPAVSIAVGESAWVYYNGTDYVKLAGTVNTGVTSFTAGTTGFTPSTATTGAVTLAGTLATTNGGTGLTSFTSGGVVYASSSSALATGSALTFNGSALLLNTATSNIQLTTSVNTNQAYISLADADGRTAVFRGPNSGSPNVAQIGTSTNHDTAFLQNNTEGMRLTSTGLGIATSSPDTKLDVASGNAEAIRLSSNSYLSTGQGPWIGFDGGPSASWNMARIQATRAGAEFQGNLLFYTNNSASDGTAATERMRIDSAGNLGLGVTPSASTLPTIQSAYGITIGNNEAHTTKNAYYNSGWKYATTTTAARFSVGEGGSDFRFYTAPSGTAGNAITFTQAMTLDASGNLTVGATSTLGRIGSVLSDATTTFSSLGYGMLGLTNTSNTNNNYTWMTFNESNTNYVGAIGTQNITHSGPSGAVSGDLVFATKTSGLGGFPTEKFRIASTGAFGLSGANYGSSGQVLTSGGSGAAPTWTTVSGGGGSAATPTALGTVYGKQTTSGGTPFLTAYGYNAGAATTGVNNVFMGVSAGQANVAGTDSVAIGYEAMKNYSAGDGINIAIGSYALTTATTGTVYYNVAIGYESMKLNTSGFGNTAIGYRTLTSNTSGRFSTAVGYNSLRSLQSGNDGSTAVGSDSLSGVTTGIYNVGVGGSTGSSINTGSYNTIMGYGALGGGSTSTSSSNVAIGYNAMASAGIKSNNVAIGRDALFALTGGGSNVAVGKDALGQNTTSSNNVSIGNGSLYSITTASGNHVAVGYEALYSATDNSNVAVGYRAGYGVTSGHNNVLIGTQAGNVSVILAGGAQNVVIGAEARTNTTGAYNEIVIGQTCNGIGNDYVTLGKLNNRVYNHYDTNATWIQASDVRLKTDIQDDSLGLSFINKLRPVKYRWKATNELEQDNPQYSEVNNKNTTAVMHGLIAQEVKAVLDEEGVDTFGGWHIESNGIQGVSREMFITPLINAIQELTAQIETLKAEVAALKGNV